jgi:hypothetical protein
MTLSPMSAGVRWLRAGLRTGELGFETAYGSGVGFAGFPCMSGAQ